MDMQFSKYSKYTIEIGIVLVFVAIISYALVSLLRYLSGILLPLAVIYLFAVVIRLPYRGLKSTQLFKTKIIPFMIVAITSIGVIVLTLELAGKEFFSQFKVLADLIKSDFPALMATIQDKLPSEEVYKSIVSNERLGFFLNPDFLGSIGKYFMTAISALGNATFSSAMALITWIIIPSFVYTLVTRPLSGAAFANLFPFLDENTRSTVSMIFSRYNIKLEKYFIKQLIQSLLQIVIVTGLFYFLDFKAAFAIAVLVGILNLIPNLGTLFLLLSSWSIAFLGNDKAWAIAFVFTLCIALFILILDNIILPKIMMFLYRFKPDWKQSADVNTSIMTVSIIFWGYLLDGLLGLVLSVPITLMLLVVVKQFEINKNVPE